jgi:putative copper resistance protein D
VGPFLDVVLRGLALCGQAVAVGGVVFALVVWRVGVPRCDPASGRRDDSGARIWRLTALGAAVVAVGQALSLLIVLVSLDAGSGWPIGEVVATPYGHASLVRIVAGLALAAGALAVARRPFTGLRAALVLVAAATLALGSAWVSHAAARVDHRALLLALDALHQLAAAVWIGGLVHLLVTALRGRGADAATIRRFSTLAMGSVIALVIAGVGLTLRYVDSPLALLGTAYGVMVLTKIFLLCGLLALGAANYFVVRRLESGTANFIEGKPSQGSPSPSGKGATRLRRFVEVETGLALTVFFAAASLTSLPPAVDVVTDRASVGEVLTRFTPRWPALTSPRHEELPANDPNAPRTDADRAWSEYNHHISGLFVLAMGLLATAEAAGMRWARHWPLIFLGLGAFMLVRNDPGAWPLGEQGFWAGMREPSVVQHRIYVLVVVLFGVFEWMVRTGRLRAPRWALVFPLVSAAGGGLLLTHSHASLNLKAEFLVEVTHIPLAVLGIFIGWSRWLELRLAGPGHRLPGWLASVALALVGVVLIFYRES